MGRMVTAVVTFAGRCAGRTRPFPVDDPWWAQVEPVTVAIHTRYGFRVRVLRLLAVEGSDGARDGHVTYHVEALEPPGGLQPCDFVADEHPLRMAWAHPDGLHALLAWAAALTGTTGPAIQHRTWNLAALFRVPTTRGPVWLKAIPPFAAAEPVALAAYRHADPALVPHVIAAEPGRLLLTDVPGTDGGSATEADVTRIITRLVAAQARLEVPPTGIPDRRPEIQQKAVEQLLDGPLRDELTPAEHTAVHRIQTKWARLAASGLPNTLVHGDFHPGNWRLTATGPVALDFADAHLGHPALDACRAIGHLPPPQRTAAARAWITAWTRAAPHSRPAHALRTAWPLAHLAYAVRYQEFLDNIEPTERLYHLGDPAAVTRHAIAAAAQPPPI